MNTQHRGSGRVGRLLAAAIVVTFGFGSGTQTPPHQRPDVILITVDTLRADHLGAYGYPRPTSPNIDRLAREGTIVAHCYSASSETAPAIASLFTSNYPHTTGVLGNGQTFPKRANLVRSLRAAGYQTAGFVSSTVLSRPFGMAVEFDHFDARLTGEELNRPRAERPARDTLRAAAAWLAAAKSPNPKFVWIHLIDPHGPYQAPVAANRFVGDAHYRQHDRLLTASDVDMAPAWSIPRYQVLGQQRNANFYIARYDAEIRYMDIALGIFFDDLKRQGRYDNSSIILTADHGETLAEPNRPRSFSHSVVAYEEDLRVPLIVKNARSAKPFPQLGTVQTIDLAPTILASVGIRAPREFAGRNLYISEKTRFRSIYGFGAYGDAYRERDVGTQFSVLKGPWRFIVNTKTGSVELFDRRVDPTERHNVAAGNPRLVAGFRQELRAVLANGSAPTDAVKLTPEYLKQMRSLGYLGP